MIELLVPREVRGALTLAVRRLGGDYREDEWGYDEHFVEALEPALETLYRRWWRTEAVGVERVPSHGPALLLANGPAAPPWDALMTATALAHEPALPRRPRILAGAGTFELPWLSVSARKLGAVPDTRGNALRLLEQGHLVLGFPEEPAPGARRERYRVRRFGRGEVIATALRAQVPVVPVAIVGAEEARPPVAGLPVIGSLGLVPLPSRWRIEFGEPLDHHGLGPDAAEDRGVVLELAEAARDRVQTMVHEGLVRREGAFR